MEILAVCRKPVANGEKVIISNFIAFENICTGDFYSYSPNKIAETFHELKLPPSLFPRGIATENLCFPGER
jgi:hypothetical protein